MTFVEKIKDLYNQAKKPTLKALLMRWHFIAGSLHIIFSLIFGIYILAVSGGSWKVRPVIQSNLWRQFNKADQTQVNYFDGTAAGGTSVPFTSNLQENVFVHYKAIQGDCTSTNPCTILTKTTDVAQDLYLDWMTFMFSIISGTAELAAFFNFEFYVNMLSSGTNYFRLADYSLSASLMWVTLSVLWFAPPTVSMIILNFFLIFQVIFLGFSSEVLAHLKRKTEATLCFTAASVAYLLGWVTVVVPFYYSNIEGTVDFRGSLSKILKPYTDEIQSSLTGFFQIMKDNSGSLPAEFNPPTFSNLNLPTQFGSQCLDYIKVDQGTNFIPDFVWVLLFGLFITFSLFPVVAIRRIIRSYRNGSTLDDYLKDEIGYVFLSFLSKITIGATVWGGLVSRSSSSLSSGPDTDETSDNNENIEATLYGALGGALLASFILAATMYWDYKKIKKAENFPNAT